MRRREETVAADAEPDCAHATFTSKLLVGRPPHRTPFRRLLHVLPSFAVGGVQVRLAQLANALGPSCQHLVLSLDGRTSCAERFDATVRFELLSPPPGSAGYSPAAIRRRRAHVRDAAP